MVTVRMSDKCSMQKQGFAIQSLFLYLSHKVLGFASIISILKKFKVADVKKTQL